MRIESCRKVAKLLLRQERSARLFAMPGETEHLDDTKARHREEGELLASLPN